MAADPFVDTFRRAAGYVHAHRGRTFVICAGDELLRGAGGTAFLHDVALLHGLGVRVVLAHGARTGMGEALARCGVVERFHGHRRLTDARSLEILKGVVGALRVDLEARLSMGLPNTPMSGARLRVASGNHVTAQPLGVLDGVDHGYTGMVRRVDVEAIETRLDSGAVVLVGPLGYSVTGDVFNVNAQDVACAVSRELRADKLILVAGDDLKALGLKDAEGFGLDEMRERLSTFVEYSPARATVECAIEACSGGVRRAHLIPEGTDGGMLLELFTRGGVGVMITSDIFEGMRAAQLRDVGGILELIRPLENEGLLVRRTREVLETQIERFFVFERDGLVLACSALLPFDGTNGELACVAVHPDVRGGGVGVDLLRFVERHARAQGFAALLTKTTRAEHWFLEQGFCPVPPEHVPRGLRRESDAEREPKVLKKGL